MISRARFMARCCSNSLGTRVSINSCFRRSARSAPFVSAHQSSPFSSPAGRSCSLHRSGTRICHRRALRFPPLRGSQPRTKRLMQHGLVHTYPQHRQLNCTQRTELVIKCFVRDDVVLILHPRDHWPESRAIRSDQKPGGLAEPLGEPRGFEVSQDL